MSAQPDGDSDPDVYYTQQDMSDTWPAAQGISHAKARDLLRRSCTMTAHEAGIDTSHGPLLETWGQYQSGYAETGQARLQTAWRLTMVWAR